MTILKVEDLGVSIDGRKIFENVNIRIDPNQFITIMGENGVGKTTFVETLFGLRHFDQGSIQIWGQPVKNPKKNPLKFELISKMQCVMATPEKYPSGITLAEFLSLMAKTFPDRWDRDLSQYLVTSFKLELEKNIDSLSLGEHSKIRLMKALAFHPKLLVLDELAANLSPESRQIVLSVLMDMFASSGNMAVLYTSHFIEESLQLSDKIFDLRKDGLYERQI